MDKSYLNEVMMEHSSDAGNAHKCQMNADKINAPTAPLSLAKQNRVAPWPFSMWGMDGPISPSNGLFLFNEMGGSGLLLKSY